MNAIVINLARCPERMDKTHQELTQHGIPYERLEAVDGKTLEIVDGRIPGFKAIGSSKEHSYRGAAGCYFSHINALTKAIQNNRFPCFIMEDDIHIVGSLEIPVTDAPIIYFGGNDNKSGVYSSHAILYRTADIANTVLAFAKKSPNSIDSIFVRLQKQQPSLFHFIRPYPIQQHDGFSFIYEIHRNASKLTRGY